MSSAWVVRGTSDFHINERKYCQDDLQSPCAMQGPRGVTVLVCTHASTRYQEETQGVSSAWVVRGASDLCTNGKKIREM